jgi:hypothetical protein
VVDKIGKYTDVKMDKAFSRLTKDYVGKSKLPLSPSAPVDKTQVKKDIEAVTREPKPAARKHRWT